MEKHLYDAFLAASDNGRRSRLTTQVKIIVVVLTCYGTIRLVLEIIIPNLMGQAINVERIPGIELILMFPAMTLAAVLSRIVESKLILNLILIAFVSCLAGSLVLSVLLLR